MAAPTLASVAQSVTNSPGAGAAASTMNLFGQYKKLYADPGTDNNRALARSLYKSQIGDMLKRDLQFDPTTRALLEKLTNNPVAHAAAAKTNPFLAEILAGVGTDLRVGRYKNTRRNILQQAELQRGSIRSRAQQHADRVKYLKSATNAYSRAAATATDPIALVKTMHRQGLDLSKLPPDVLAGLKRRAQAQVDDKGGSMGFMVNRWHTGTQLRDIERLKKHTAVEYGRLKSGATASRKADDMMRTLAGIRLKRTAPIDSGRYVNIRPTLAMIANAAKTAELIDILGDLTKTANLIDMMSASANLDRRGLYWKSILDEMEEGGKNRSRRGATTAMEKRLSEKQLTKRYVNQYIIENLIKGGSTVSGSRLKPSFFDKLNAIIGED